MSKVYDRVQYCFKAVLDEEAAHQVRNKGNYPYKLFHLLKLLWWCCSLRKSIFSVQLLCDALEDLKNSSCVGQPDAHSSSFVMVFFEKLS